MAPRALFQGDIIRRPNSEVAMILRTAAEEQFNPLHPPAGQAPHPLDRPLLPGEIGISTLVRAPDAAADASNLNIINSEDVELIDRLMQPGDVVKRDYASEASGIVKSVEVGCRLKHVLSGQQLEGFVSSNELEGALKVSVSEMFQVEMVQGSYRDQHQVWRNRKAATRARRQLTYGSSR